MYLGDSSPPIKATGLDTRCGRIFSQREPNGATKEGLVDTGALLFFLIFFFAPLPFCSLGVPTHRRCETFDCSN